MNESLRRMCVSHYSIPLTAVSVFVHVSRSRSVVTLAARLIPIRPLALHVHVHAHTCTYMHMQHVHVHVVVREMFSNTKRDQIPNKSDTHTSFGAFTRARDVQTGLPPEDHPGDAR